MNCLDSSFVIDYWDGKDFAKEFLTNADEPIGIPTVALFELYVGATLSDSPNEDIGTVVEDLDWAEPLPFDDAAARGAALTDKYLITNGERINAMDVLIAATARAQNATLIATDTHFERVPGLDVHNPRPGEEDTNG